jgi:hypothetical protein
MKFARPQRLPAKWKLWGVVFVAYLLITVVSLWNLVSNFGTAVSNGHLTDFHQFLWGFWWIGYALQNGISPLSTNYVLSPQVSNMAIHTLAAIWFPLYAVTAPVVGYVGAGNTIIVSCFLLSALAMFGWLRRVLPFTTASTVIAFIGGLAFAFSPYLFAYSSVAQDNITPIFWFPVILLLWDEIAFPRRWARPLTAILLALACWGLWLTDLEYVIWVPTAITGFVLWTLWANRQDRKWLPLIIWGAVAAVIMMALAWIYPLGALLQVNLDPNQFPPAGMETIRAYSMPISALFGLAPNGQTATYGHLLVWLTWAIILIGLFGATFRRSIFNRLSQRAKPIESIAVRTYPLPNKWLWLVLALPTLILSLGPDIQIGGIDIPLPYLALYNLLKGQYRAPGRFAGATLALLITFLAVAWVPFFIHFAKKYRVRAGLVAGIVSVTFLADGGAFTPFPVRFMPDWPIYHQIAQDKRDFVIMDVPVGVRYGWTGIGQGDVFMYYGPVHQHRMVNGEISRIPYSEYIFFLNSPLFSWLANDNSDNDAKGRAAAAAQFKQYLHEWPIGYVILHRDWLTQAQQDDWVGWVNTQPGLCPPQLSPDSVLIWWRNQDLGCDTTPQSDQSVQIAMGNPTDWGAIGSGWYDQETIGGPAARWAQADASLRLTLNPANAYTLTFSALPFGDNRTVTFSGSGWTSAPITLTGGNWNSYSVTIPVGALQDGLLMIHHNGADSPKALGLSTDLRTLAAAYRSFTFQ